MNLIMWLFKGVFIIIGCALLFGLAIGLLFKMGGLVIFLVIICGIFSWIRWVFK